MPWVGFKPTILAFERVKPVHALHGAATVIGSSHHTRIVKLHCAYICHHFHACYMSRASYPPWSDHRENVWWRMQLMKFLVIEFYSVSYCFSGAGMVTGYGLDDRGVGVRAPVGSRIFSSSQRPDRLRGPPSLLSSWYRGALSLGIKRPGRDADH
jgi:hypothetical protein